MHGGDPHRRLIVAIDGPSGVGKGTVSRALAEALGYRHVDTGVMYRAVGWKAARDGVAFNDEAALESIARNADIAMSGGRVEVDGHDVTQDIRSAEMDSAASAVGILPRVRAALVARQRAMGRDGGIVMEGRDIGTVVFPEADVKIFLDAAPEERARRRANDPAHGAAGTRSAADVASDLAARDRQDSNRAASPLAVAPGAVVIDTTDLSIPDVVARALAIVQSKQGLS
jgi:cytidylate kinase